MSKSISTYCVEFHPDIPLKEQREIIENVASETNLIYESETPDLVVAYGGDGTVLRSARKYHGANSLILGVNAGKDGYLTAGGDLELSSLIQNALDGKDYRSHRMMLSARHNDTDIVALNDIVLHRGAINKVIPLEVSIDNHEPIHLFGDGLIISTPTGSTAYNLSCGGPAIHPEHTAIILTAIAPMKNKQFYMVLSSESTITIASPLNESLQCNHDSESILCNLHNSPLQVDGMSEAVSLSYPNKRLFNSRFHSFIT